MANEKKMDCVILGLLSHESMTGYEIKKTIDTTLHFFWSGSYGSIYPTLGKLVEDGLVTKFETTENGRNKVIYTITEHGNEYLKSWLKNPVEKDELRYETLLKLFFGSEVGEKETLIHICAFEEKIKGELQVLEQMVAVLEKIKDNAVAHQYYLMTARFGVRSYHAYLEWCTEAKQILEGGC